MILFSTLGLYLSRRFIKTIALVFLALFVIIYIADFVEMMRRGSDAPGVSSTFLAFLTLLRVPTIAEQILPFAVLGGTMIAFVALSRRLELVIIRAAGVSVWQFLAPPTLIVFALGILSVTLYNPLAADLKQRADAIETRIFGKTAQGSETSLWIRQRSIDGQSIIRAERSSDGGRTLGGVSAFVYEPDGSFMERVEAANATLLPGFWTMTDARITAPGEEPQTVGTYILATNLSAEQVTQSFVAPAAVPFWDLADVSARTEAAGLDASGYRLHFQSLLARPLLLVAMVFIAASFSLRFFRFGGVSRMVSGGVVSGFVLYVATKLATDLGGAGVLSAPVAAWLPAVVGSMLGILVLLYQEDG
ncbi:MULTISPECIES: LPS export ABC transporter permease LptG [unclassified Beijerinckia]|uniref:LPS export ABC transporter permease LptG n=1 Tax=unclassified Beijerinckia TaxID=2638183 RepID=UPI00089CAE87|nr:MULTISPECIES: LPS export ABC transporter permease LptG [unclassified Beijerinckia]MDH7795707.1 lipopolysaccharide export system permease protein [Beijerinckia sp. GAS462]SEC12726.1 lipopolysaccharide export system permease protein [Beijerinckia sp. 28-YEA-48]